MNRAEKDAQDVNLSLANFASDGTVKTLTLQNLQGETFVSHTENALQAGTATAAGNKVSLKLPAKSITAVLLTTATPKQVVDGIIPTGKALAGNMLHRDNGGWAINNGLGNVHSLHVFNSRGQNVLQVEHPARGSIRLAGETLGKGVFVVRVKSAGGMQIQKIDVK